jgi:hypothetical protein
MSQQMSLCLIARQELKQSLGDFGNSVFVRLEKYLWSHANAKDALRGWIQNHASPAYRDDVDALLCSLWPRWRSGCMRFYIGGGPRFKLCPGVTKGLINKYDAQMVGAVQAIDFERAHCWSAEGEQQ